MQRESRDLTMAVYNSLQITKPTRIEDHLNNKEFSFQFEKKNEEEFQSINLINPLIQLTCIG